MTVSPSDGRNISAEIGKSVMNNFIIDNPNDINVSYTATVSDTTILSLTETSGNLPAESNTISEFTATCPETEGDVTYSETITYSFELGLSSDPLVIEVPCNLRMFLRKRSK